MDKSKKMTRSSGPKSCKSAQRELTSEQNCRIVSSLYKTLGPDLNRPPKFNTCQGCSSSTCYSCPEESFVDESVLEQVSDDLSLLRCHFCEWTDNPTYAHFCPEPWFNKEIILERLNSLKDVLRLAGGEAVPEAKLTEQGLMDDLIDRIIQTIEDGDHHHKDSDVVSDKVDSELTRLRNMYLSKGQTCLATMTPQGWMGKKLILSLLPDLAYMTNTSILTKVDRQLIVDQIVHIKIELDGTVSINKGEQHD